MGKLTYDAALDPPARTAPAIVSMKEAFAGLEENSVMIRLAGKKRPITHS